MTDNPYYITPEEAEEKTCPYDAKNWGTCMSSQCMAWRWGKQAAQTDYKIIEHFDNESLIHINYEYSTTHGYCGMVRT